MITLKPVEKITLPPEKNQILAEWVLKVLTEIKRREADSSAHF